MYLEVITKKPVSVARSTPVLFVHGMWHAAWCWTEHFLPYFSQHGYVAHALSLRGHGSSEGRERLRWTSLNDYLSDVTQVASQLSAPPILVGHSMGGMIVQKYLETHETPAAVLLASAPPKGLIPATLRMFLRHPLATAKAISTLSLFPVVGTPGLAHEALFSANMPEGELTSYFSRLQDESFRVYLDMLGLNLPRIGRITAKPFVLGAKNDITIIPKEVEATACAYGVKADILPGIAHDMMLEANWQVVADRILVWLDEKGM